MAESLTTKARHRSRDARVQTRRAQEERRRQGRQGEEPPPGDRHRLERGRRLEAPEPAPQRSHLHKTERKEAQGKTAQQEREGKSRVGARGKRESTRAMGGKNARKPTASGLRLQLPGRVVRRLHAPGVIRRAQRKGVSGRSHMNKQQLKNALGLR